MKASTNSPIVKLRRFLAPKPQTATDERCQFCNAEMPSEHGHVVNVETRQLLCACRACSLLFASAGAAQGKYRTVPRRFVSLEAPVFTDGQWDALQIPVGIAFFFFNTSLDRMAAFYPSPVGAMESVLPLDAWQDAVRRYSVLDTIAPDVEALLVHKRHQHCEGYLVPIDACYELVGRIRRHWKGFDGGEAAWKEIDAFFSEVRIRSEE